MLETYQNGVSWSEKDYFSIVGPYFQSCSGFSANLLSAGPSQSSLLPIATETGTQTCVFQANSRYSYQQGKEIRIRDLQEALFHCLPTRTPVPSSLLLHNHSISAIFATLTLPHFLRCVINIIIAHYLRFSVNAANTVSYL